MLILIIYAFLSPVSYWCMVYKKVCWNKSWNGLRRYMAWPSITIFYGRRYCCFQQKLIIWGLHKPLKWTVSVQLINSYVKGESSGNEYVLVV